MVDGYFMKHGQFTGDLTTKENYSASPSNLYLPVACPGGMRLILTAINDGLLVKPFCAYFVRLLLNVKNGMKSTDFMFISLKNIFTLIQ